jgi:hypothetical protein
MRKRESKELSSPGAVFANGPRMRSRFFTVVLACAIVAGCTRGVVSPDQIPTGPTAQLTDITITPVGGGTITVGGSAPIVTSGGLPTNAAALGAFARFSDGTGRYVEASWTSSDDNVIAVTGTTLVARGRGTVTLTATFQGRSDTENFVAEGGIAGRWAGSYLVEQCNANSGSMAEVLCGAPGRAPGVAAVGTALPFTMDISENETDLTAVVSFGHIRGTLTGKTRGGGFFYLQGFVEGAGGAINIVHWDTRVVRDSMEGFIAYEVKIGSLPGIGTVAARLNAVTRQ